MRVLLPFVASRLVGTEETRVELRLHALEACVHS